MNIDTLPQPEQQESADTYTLVFYMQVAARLASKIGSQKCRDPLVRPPFADVMLMIEQNPGIRQGQCAEGLGLDATTFGRYVDRLTRHGMVQRHVPEHDRRSVTLSLTDQGMQLLAGCGQMIRDIEREGRERMGTEDWEKLVDLLKRFLVVHDHPLTGLNGNGQDKG